MSESNIEDGDLSDFGPHACPEFLDDTTVEYRDGWLKLPGVAPFQCTSRTGLVMHFDHINMVGRLTYNGDLLLRGKLSEIGPIWKKITYLLGPPPRSLEPRQGWSQSLWARFTPEQILQILQSEDEGPDGIS